MVVLRQELSLELLGLKDHRAELVAGEFLPAFADPLLNEKHRSAVPKPHQAGHHEQERGKQDQNGKRYSQIENAFGDQIAP